MKNLKWIILAFALVVLIGGAGVLYKNLSKDYTPQENTQSQYETVPAPDFTVTDLEGNSVKLSDFKGKPVVINFWASWCYYCVEEMPDFEKASAEYPDVQFMMINATDGQRETEEIARDFIKEKGYKLDVFLDTKLDAVRNYYVNSFPNTVLVDKDGNFAGRVNGAINYETLISGIKTIL